jgi:hypothetical protein
MRATPEHSGQPRLERPTDRLDQARPGYGRASNQQVAANRALIYRPGAYARGSRCGRQEPKIAAAAVIAVSFSSMCPYRTLIDRVRFGTGNGQVMCATGMAASDRIGMVLAHRNLSQAPV